MHPDLHRYLDGELPKEALPPELRAEADEWGTLVQTAALGGAEQAPPWLEQRVMRSLPAEPRPAPWRRAWHWLVQPQPIRLRPLEVALAGAAAAVLILVWPDSPAREPEASAPTQPGFVSQAGVAPVVYVQFVFAAADAQEVAVAGDFNGWEPARSVLRDPDGDGVWTGLFALPPGVHKYMFVVDGERWVTDPRAERFVDDGFGMRNALIAVVAPGRDT